MWQYNYDYYDLDSDELMHYGIPGMKWGYRRYQDEDGSLTNAGRKRALKDSKTKWGKARWQPSSSRSSTLAAIYLATGNKRIAKKLSKSNDEDAIRWIIAKRFAGAKINDLRRLETTLNRQKVEELISKLYDTKEQ